jgi:Snf7
MQNFHRSRHPGAEEKEALREAATADRWHPLYHRDAARGSGRCQHQHGCPAVHEERRRSPQERPPAHVSEGFAAALIGFDANFLFRRDVDQVHDMMDDIAEQQDVAREISDAISNPVAFGQDIDEVILCI